jgi:hypothetical protein
MSGDPENSDETVETGESAPLTPKEKRALARREARAAIPAVFVDSWATLTWYGHIRIVMGEWLVRKNNYRMAFVMELEQAKEFAEDLLGRIEKRQQEDAVIAKANITPSGEC